MLVGNMSKIGTLPVGTESGYKYDYDGLDEVPMSGPQLALQEIGLKFLGSHKL